MQGCVMKMKKMKKKDCPLLLNQKDQFWVEVDLDEIHSIDPSYSKDIHTIVIAKLGMISSGIGLSH